MPSGIFWGQFPLLVVRPSCSKGPQLLPEVLETFGAQHWTLSIVFVFLTDQIIMFMSFIFIYVLKRFSLRTISPQNFLTFTFHLRRVSMKRSCGPVGFRSKWIRWRQIFQKKTLRAFSSHSTAQRLKRFSVSTELSNDSQLNTQRQ